MSSNLKQTMRRSLLSARRSRPPAGSALTAVALSWAPLQQASTVAAYLPLPHEPDISGVVEALFQAGTTVLLPVLQVDHSLDWGVYQGRADLVAGPAGTWQPRGPLLGPRALGQADVVLVPGVAVDRRGTRLGRGGGSYDRALASLPPTALTAVVLYDEEIVEEVPSEEHDQRVTAALTPSGIVTLS